jgi:hypothetical protein
MFVNALSTEDVAAHIEHLWEDALAHSGLTELTLHSRMILRKVVPHVGLWWVWVYKGWLLSVKALTPFKSLTFMEDTEALRIRPVVEGPECIFGTGDRAPSSWLWHSRQWLAPIDG